jgi:endothelin-converting enzyme/putative endopeptidase
MRWSLLNRASSQLSTDIEEANFEFYESINRWCKRPSDERALQVINGRIGEALESCMLRKVSG